MSTTRPVLGFALCSILAACGGGDDAPLPGVDGGGSTTADRPETTITEAPESPTNQARARLEFESDQPDSDFECQIAGRDAVSCTSPFELDLPDGSHRFIVTAMTPSGLRDLSPDEHTWTIDTVAPISNVFQRPAAVDNSLSPRFDYYTTDLASAEFHCQLDEGAFVPCPPPYLPGPLTEGPHTVTIRATDTAGNVEVAPEAMRWIIDLSPPDTTIETGPTGLVNTRDASFTFTTPDGAAGSTFRCRLDDGAWAACTSPHQLTDLIDGGHSFDVVVLEPLGTSDPTPARRMWNVDATAPHASINAGPDGPTSDNTPTFLFVVEGGTPTVQCRVTGATTPELVPCGSSYTSPALPDGPATFELRAVDAAGNIRLRTRAFTVDTVGPTIVVTAAPAALGNDNTPTFTWTAGDAVTLRCSVDHAPIFNCSSLTYTPGSAQNDGNHSFEIVAIDSASNATTITRNYAIDTVAPYLSIGWGAPTLTTDTTPSFPFTAGGPTECRMDTQPFVACTSPFTAASLADGVHRFHVRTSDPAGNVRATSHAVTIDTRPLDITIVSGPIGVTNDRTPSFTWTTTGAVLTLGCRYDAEPFAECTTTMEQSLADGPHTFEVQAHNDLPAEFSATQSFTVDTVAPGVVFTGGPTGTITTSSVSFTFETSGDPAVTECRLYRQGQPSGAYAPCATPHHAELAPPTTPYPFVFEVRVRDAAGNQWSAYRPFTYAPAP